MFCIEFSNTVHPGARDQVIWSYVGGGVKAYCQSVGLIQLADRQIMIGSGAQTIIKTPLSGRIAEAIRIWYLGSLCGDRWKNTADKGGRRASLKD